MAAGPKSVLVIDDDAANLKLLRVLLTFEGYEVVTAERAQTALDHVAARAPQLILMDLQLPGIDGLALTRRFKADPATRAIPIIAITARAMKKDADEAREAGCDDYMAKPIHTRALIALVARYLSRSGLDPSR
jgi:CheY-like chemotaxis protein